MEDGMHGDIEVRLTAEDVIALAHAGRKVEAKDGAGYISVGQEVGPDTWSRFFERLDVAAREQAPELYRELTPA